MTNWSYNLYKILDNFNATISSYKINILPERNIEALLIKTRLTMNEDVMKALESRQIEMSLSIWVYTNQFIC